MMNQNGKNFTYLNRAGRWLGHHWDGLEIAPDGALRLAALPLGDPADTQAMSELPTPDGPAGIAMDGLGGIYFSDPPENCVRAIDGCDESQRKLPCLRGEGYGPGHLKQPRGLCWSQSRRALIVVDGGNNRIQIIEPRSGTVLEIWGGPGQDAGQFDTPWTIAADAADSFYVADYGNRRVQKFSTLGEALPGFWDNVAVAKIVSQPSDVAAGVVDGEIRIYLVDAAAHAVFVVDSYGNPVLDASGKPVSFGAGQLEQPMGIATIGASVFVGDNGLRQVLEFDAAAGYRFAGAAVGFQGSVAALAAGSPGQLLVLPGGDASPIVLQLDEGYGKQGVFWSDAISVPRGKVSWHRLEAICGDLGADAHLQLFVHTSDNALDAPAPPKLAPAGGNPFTDPRWRPRPADVTDIFIGGGAASFVWCGAWFSGDGLGTPSVAQMRVEFDHETYLADLPAIYRKGGVCADFLLRLMSLFETFNQETEKAIGNLPALFDSQAAPDAYLTWLAEWLAVDLEEDWDDATVRRAIAEAFASYARRGTPAGLKAALKQYAGVDAIIEEPLLNAAWWALPAPAASPCGTQTAGTPVTWQDGENSMLGYTTMLAPAEAQGAVVGTTAVLDQSHLITDADFGVPLFADVAFQFSVSVYRGQVNCPAALALVQSVIDREKSAHTTCRLSIVEPSMTVGFQARVGIDAVVGGPPVSMRLGEAAGLGVDTALGGPAAARIGEGSQLGSAILAG